MSKFGFAIVTLSPFINYKKEKNIVIYSDDELVLNNSSSDLKEEVRTHPNAWYGNMQVNLVKGRMPNKGTIMLTSAMQQMFNLPDIFAIIDGVEQVNPAFTAALSKQYVVEITEAEPREAADGKHYRRYNFTPQDSSIWPVEQWNEIFSALRQADSKRVDVTATVDMDDATVEAPVVAEKVAAEVDPEELLRETN